MLEGLLIFGIYLGFMFAAFLAVMASLGILLLVDLVFKTHIGRRVCKSLFCE